MSTLTVDTIQGKTTAGTVAIPGHIVQVTHAIKTDVFTTSNRCVTDGFVDTGLNCSITPKFQSSLIMINATVSMGSTTGSFAYFRMMRNIAGGTYAMSAEPDADGARPLVHGMVYEANTDGMGPCSESFVAVESLNTTSVVNFKVQMGGSGTTNIKLNASGRDNASTDYDGRSSSRIILMEIAQ
tara:strand:- start:1647 stop:2198 length:552 start_codon:yes stop_codon:yes gene_type:complete